MPVYWFAVSFVDRINFVNAGLAFVILHVLVYPSSNGYNSYMDRDETSIGGLAQPLQPTRQLFIVSIVMDVLALGLSLLISTVFAVCIFIYITCSRLYSYRGIRLKQYPLLGYAIVILNQGALTFFMVYHAANDNLDVHMSWLQLIASTLLIGGFYPLTQVYQHEADEKDDVTTISMLLGKRGTFVFCAAMYSLALLVLWLYYSAHNMYTPFIVLVAFFLPVTFYFAQWFLQVLKSSAAADFRHTMKMNWLASTCTSAAFITIILLQKKLG